MDLIRIDQRYLSLPYRYAYAPFSDASRPFDEARAGNLKERVSNSYGRFDLRNGKIDSYFAGDTHSLQEPYFVPHAKEGPEGAGYLIGVAANYAEMRSELIIADAQNLAAGDVARVILPFRSTQQVHGIWVDESELPSRNPTRGNPMTRETRDTGSTTFTEMTRRTFVAHCAATAASGAAFYSMSRFAVPARATELLNTLPPSHRTPVVSFHNDRPYLDMTGMADPYQPPSGTRSGQPLAELSEEEYFSRYIYS